MSNLLKVLIIGGGGREYMLAWLFSKSPLVERVIVAPGNPGIAMLEKTECEEIAATDIAELLALAQRKKVNLTVVGPEGPLGLGIVNTFEAKGHTIFGPTKEQAQLELSKCLAFAMQQACSIPSPAGEIFESCADALSYLQSATYPLVIKPDGGTEGKGVKICHTVDEAVEHVEDVMVNHIYQKTGDTGEQILIQEFLVGREMSITVITDGKTHVTLPDSEDHKQRFDGDTGPMTGGIGAVSPSPIMTKELKAQIENEIVKPLIEAINKKLGGYKGFLYIALMITDDGPKVIELNVRGGDPEMQVVLPRVKTDLVPIFLAIAEGRLGDVELDISEKAMACVTMVSKDYPKPGYRKGMRITGMSNARKHSGAIVVQAGTKKSGSSTVANDGRVLCVVREGVNIADAVEKTYATLNLIKFEDSDFRTDIGLRVSD